MEHVRQSVINLFEKRKKIDLFKEDWGHELAVNDPIAVSALIPAETEKDIAFGGTFKEDP